MYGPYQPPNSANDLWQTALADPASQFRAGRVGVRAAVAANQAVQTSPTAPAGQASQPWEKMLFPHFGPNGSVTFASTPQVSPMTPQAANAPQAPAAIGFGPYQQRYDANAIWQQAMADPMSQFRAGRVGVRGQGTFVPPGVGNTGGSAQPAGQPSQPAMPQLGNFYTPYSPGDVQNLPSSTIGSNFLGEYATRRRDT